MDLRSFDNLARFNAAGTNLHPAIAARGKLYSNRLQIRVEPAAGLVVSM